MVEVKWAKISNQETKTVDVGLGTNEDFYKSIGMTKQLVEKCEWNDQWYLEGYVPEQPEPTPEEKVAELKRQLNALDEKSARSMRAILAETATADDRAYLANLETQAEDLRRQIRDLENAQ